MSQDKWKIGPPARSFVKYFKTHHEDTQYIPEFENDVTRNPRYHEIRGRIRPVKRDDIYPDDTWRWTKRHLRIVYHVEDETKTIWPLGAGTAAGIRYKKL